MALFTLPLSAANGHKHSASSRRAQSKVAIPPRKRKRSPHSSSADSPSQDSADDDSLSDTESHFTTASTNPLSLAPTEILQYRLAGLELHEALPNVRDFPHRAVPTPKDVRRRGIRKAKSKSLRESEVEAVQSDSQTGSEDEGEHERGPRLRIQHLGVLTAILHKCLMEDDIPRASRAWALLVRTEVGGRAIDIRSTGYWTIGAHLLSKDRDAGQPGSNPLTPGDESDTENPTSVSGSTEREFGTKEGREKAKTYFEQLILQYPYKRQFRRHGNLSALEIWPKMVTWEIYGIQFEQKQSLKRIADTARDENADEGSDSSGSSEGNTSEAESRTSSEAEERRDTRRRRQREARSWKQREEVRQTTLKAAEQLAARLDTLMVNVPYSDDHNMLEIRAHLALYVGDLSVPEKPIEDEDSSDEDMEEAHTRGRRLSRKDLDAEHRLQLRARLHNHEVGKRRREDELDRAKALVAKIRRSGGKIDDFGGVELDQEDIDPNAPPK